MRRKNDRGHRDPLVYPKAHAALQHQIAEHFLLISPVPVKRHELQDYRRNRLFFPERNIVMSALTEATVIVDMPTALDAPPEAVVVLDRGLATEGNVAWLRERRRVFDASRAVAIGTAGGQRAPACAETDGNGETRLRCASAQRAEQERAMPGIPADHPQHPRTV